MQQAPGCLGDRRGKQPAHMLQHLPPQGGAGEQEDEEEEDEEELEDEAALVDEDEEYYFDEEDEEEEEEEEGRELGNNGEHQDGEPPDNQVVGPPGCLDIPVRIPATEVKKQYKVVKGEPGGDREGAQVGYCCLKCGKAYASERSVEDHILVVHMKILRYSCQVCGRHFGWRAALLEHMQDVHELTTR